MAKTRLTSRRGEREPNNSPGILFDGFFVLGENINSPLYVGLWRSWERASMAWKRSSVRSRPGPPSTLFLWAAGSHLEPLKRAPVAGFIRMIRLLKGASLTAHSYH